MLSLTIADREEAILPDPRDPLVQIWRDYKGEVCAYAYSLSDNYWLHVPNVASFRFGRKRTEIVAIPEPAVKYDKIQDIFSRVVLPIALHASGMEVLHASAVVTKAGLVAFCAMADTGKSTTAYALSQRGYTQWADDAVPFEPETDQVIAVPLPFGIRLDPDAKQYLDVNNSSSKRIFPENQRLRIAALIVLKRFTEEDQAEVTVNSLSPAQAFRSVLLHGHFFNLKTSDLMRQMVSNYMQLTSLVPVYEVRFRPGFERISLLLDRLELLFRELSGEST